MTLIARELGVARSSVKRAFRDHGLSWPQDRRPGDLRGVDYRRDASIFHQPELDRQREVIRARCWADKEPLNGLTIADPHAPEQCYPLAKEAFEGARQRFGDWPDITVVDGDVGHWESLGPYPTTKAQLFDRTLDAAVRFLQFVADRTKRWVVVVRGNHDDRLERVLRHGVIQKDPKLAEKIGAEYDTMRLLDRESAEKVLTHGGWWVRIGNDLVIVHPDKFSSVPMRSATGARDWFDSHRWMFPGVRVLMMGHSHHWGDIMYHDCRVIETGCICWHSDYSLGRKFGPAEKEDWYHGYAVWQLELDGSVPWRSVETVNLDDVYRRLPGMVASPIWEKPPDGLADQPVWLDDKLFLSPECTT